MTKVGSSGDDEEEEDAGKTAKVPMYQIMQEKYQTIVIDTVENLVDLAEQATCQEFGVRDLSEITGRQNGYSIYRKDFKTQVNKLCSYGYTCCFHWTRRSCRKKLMNLVAIPILHSFPGPKGV